MYAKEVAAAMTKKGDFLAKHFSRTIFPQGKSFRLQLQMTYDYLSNINVLISKWAKEHYTMLASANVCKKCKKQ